VPVPAHACTFPAVTCNNKKFLRVSCWTLCAYCASAAT
jgi:hypothetical protein